MPAVTTQSIREIITAEPSAAAVLERFDIDLCSCANDDLDRVCAKLQLSLDQVLEKLADAQAKAHGAALPDFQALSITRLIQYIVRTHHKTVRQHLPPSVELSRRVASEVGDKAPYLHTVANLLEKLCADMLAHLQTEENVLFPHIVRMEEASEARESAPAGACFSSVARPISMMMREHNSAQNIVAELRQATNGFKAPEWACPRNLALHASLAAFESDLQQHMHLENDVLFPRTIALEAQLS